MSSVRAVARQFSDDELLATRDAVANFLRHWVDDPELAADVGQEVAARLLANRWRLDPTTLRAYALVTARNLVVADHRRLARAAAHLPRLYSPAGGPPPEEAALLAAEHAAVAAALARLSERDRALLTGQLGDGAVADGASRAWPPRPAADGAGSRDTARRVALSRARARLRLEYLLGWRGVSPPLSCRRVLAAIALGQRQRQRDLGADRHLLDCPTCARLVPELLARQRPLVIILPLAAAGAGRRLLRAAGHHPGHVGLATAGTAAAVTAAVVLASHGHHRPAPAARALPPTATAPAAAPAHRPPRPVPPEGPPVLRSGRADLLAAAGGRRLVGFVGDAAIADRVPVLSVPTDDGFWVGRPGAAVWVAVEGPPPGVRAGRLVSFRGTVAANPAGYPASVDLAPGPASRLLAAERAHIALAGATVSTAAAPR